MFSYPPGVVGSTELHDQKAPLSLAARKPIEEAVTLHASFRTITNFSLYQSFM